MDGGMANGMAWGQLRPVANPVFPAFWERDLQCVIRDGHIPDSQESFVHSPPPVAAGHCPTTAYDRQRNPWNV
jgi:hypothetical protein